MLWDVTEVFRTVAGNGTKNTQSFFYVYVFSLRCDQNNHLHVGLQHRTKNS